jgi:hypothetical protein
MRLLVDVGMMTRLLFAREAKKTKDEKAVKSNKRTCQFADALEALHPFAAQHCSNARNEMSSAG